MNTRGFFCVALTLCACEAPRETMDPDTPVTAPVDPAPGISRELASHRAANIRDVTYTLSFTMKKGMAAVRGSCTAAFQMASPGPIVIDFAGESLTNVRCNGASDTHRRVHNHVVFANGKKGQNEIHAEFTSKVAPTGTPLTVYRDKTDGSEYYYTLVVPADAHRLFPCFDQPDLKAEYRLTVHAPNDYEVIANGMIWLPPNVQITPTHTEIQRHEFSATRPLSTYLFAFSAGPFTRLEGPAIKQASGGTVPMTAYVRKSKLALLEKDLLFEMHSRAVRWLDDYFAYPYPFGKLDFVLVPGFPYGGMEHAGAIFYRETALVFEQQPTEGELTRRSTLINHEVSHQWFGNLVTMEWFDDLWLKEGFATFMGYTLFETLEPGKHAWLRFHHRVKPRAYAVDGTSGTTPVYQKLANLADAKSAYGAIVYNKAPAILRELNHRLGPATFQRGLQIFLKRHEFANATWRDLIAALEEAAKTGAAPWSNRWILAAGMPRVEAQWTAADGKLTAFAIAQESVQGDDGTWPLQLEILLLDADGRQRAVKAVADGKHTAVPTLLGAPAPACVLLNPKDIAYGQFLLDPTSQRWLIDNAAKIGDALTRAVAMSALFETVREARLDPLRYADAAIALLEREQDPGTHSWLLGSLGTALLRYTPAARRGPALRKLSELLHSQLTTGPVATKTQTLRFLMRACTDAATMSLCERVATADGPVHGMAIGKRDRFLAATALLAAGRGRQALDAVIGQFGQEDVARDAFVAGAADPAAKAEYFARYANLEDPPEQWTSMSLGNFHWPGQSELTLPFLRRALDQVEWVKKNRKIFFMPAWIDAFVNGHSSRQALDVVQSFLAERRDLSIDIRQKILQSLDSLQRTVRIRDRWN